MSGMFWGSPFNQDIGSWNVSNVTDMKEMFCVSNFNQDISNWDVRKVTDMSFMFSHNIIFNQDLSGWNVDNVTYCSYFSTQAQSWTLPKPNFTNCNPN
jgi:surface protein